MNYNTQFIVVIFLYFNTFWHLTIIFLEMIVVVDLKNVIIFFFRKWL